MHRKVSLIAFIAAALPLLSACGTADKAPPLVKAEIRERILGDPKAVAQAQHALNALGYDTGGADGTAGPKTEKAIRAYQMDEKLAQTGRLTAELAERLKTQRAKLPGKTWAPAERGLAVISSEGPAFTLERTESGALTWIAGDGAKQERPVNFLLFAADGVQAEAPANFLQPLRPGASGEYQLRRGDAVSTVRCTVGPLARTAVPAGAFDTIEATCRDTAEPLVERRFAYAPELRLVVREEIRAEGQDARLRELVAMRPSTQSWPTAAAVGLDWAVTHALEAAGEDEAVRWSSTGVKERFAITVDRATPIVIPGGSSRCLRYELIRTDGQAKRYPGLACKSEKGPWVIPAAVPVPIAHPSLGLPSQEAKAGP